MHEPDSGTGPSNTSITNSSKDAVLMAELETYRSMVKEFDAILESIYDGLFITDGDGNTLRVNSSWEKITGLSRKDVIGKNLITLEREGYCSRSAGLMVLQEKKPVTIRYRMNSGKEVLSSGIPIFDEEGCIVKVVTSVRDLTDIRRLSSQLEKSKKLTEHTTFVLCVICFCPTNAGWKQMIVVSAICSMLVATKLRISHLSRRFSGSSHSLVIA